MSFLSFHLPILQVGSELVGSEFASELPLLLPVYIDPGAGGMLIQILLGGIAGLFVIMKLYWKRLVQGVRGGPESSDSVSPANANAAPSAEPEPTGSGEARE